MLLSSSPQSIQHSLECKQYVLLHFGFLPLILQHSKLLPAPFLLFIIIVVVVVVILCAYLCVPL